MSQYTTPRSQGLSTPVPISPEEERMWRRFAGVSAWCFLFLAAVQMLSAQGLKAGVAKVDITPPAGVKMWGYGNRKGPATGTLDPLFARVLVLEAGGKRVALVTLDFGRCFGPSSLARLRKSAEESSHVNYVLVAGTHTHSGPVIQDEYKDGPPAWENTALDRINEAIATASQ